MTLQGREHSFVPAVGDSIRVRRCASRVGAVTRGEPVALGRVGASVFDPHPALRAWTQTVGEASKMSMLAVVISSSASSRSLRAGSARVLIELC
jgi:hypothetical protein